MAIQEEREASMTIFKQATEDARDALLAILRDDTNPADARVAAAKEILARGWGAVPSASVIEGASDEDG